MVVVGRRREGLGVLGDASTAIVLEVHDPLELGTIDAFGIMDVAAGIRKRDDPTTEIENLLGGVLGHVPATGDEAVHALEGHVAGRQHLGREVDRAVAGGLGADQTAAPVGASPGQHAGEAVGDLPVLTEEVADLATPTPMSPAGTSVSGPMN